MKILFLGTGTSTGVPQIGCNCAVCSSSDPKDNRLRASVLISDNENEILIDCGPDLRQQLLKNKITKISSILLTHEHYDHVGGLDDVRPLGSVNVYAEQNVLKVIRRNLPYCFVENKYPGVPLINLHTIDTNEFYIGKTKIQPVRIYHYKLPILGFRIGKIAYLTDVKTIDEKVIEQLQNLDVLVLSALRINEHISHLSLEQALELKTKINAKQTYFTHMSHDMGLHAVVNKLLPKNVQLAFDGLEIEV
ncbi:MAG: MBL fold metallo-hydrolase [Paludibacter sp.]|nr:MBL fold metallo-hydrolase [Paludibacter sp.]